MATEIVLLADTHLPKRAKALPAEVWRAVEAADVVFHAGDWVDVATLDALESRAQQVVGVWGNNDGPELRARLPEVARVELEGVRFVMTHETGAATGREGRMDARFATGAPAAAATPAAATAAAAAAAAAASDVTTEAAADSAAVAAPAPHVLVFGHSHTPWDTVTPAGLRLLNPGSPTDRRRQPQATFVTARLDSGQMLDVTLHRIER